MPAAEQKVPIDPSNLLWYKLLEGYRNTGGVGLSPTALCYLTGQSWEDMRAEFLAVAGDSDNLFGRKLGYTYCYTVKAHLLVWSRYGAAHRLDKEALDKLDEQTEKWPAPQYKGVRKHKGQTKLTVHYNTQTLPQLRDIVRIHRGEAPRVKAQRQNA